MLFKGKEVGNCIEVNSKIWTNRGSSRLTSTTIITPTRRSFRRLSLNSIDSISPPQKTPTKQFDQQTLEKPPKNAKSIKRSHISSAQIEKGPTREPFSPASPDLSERRKRKREGKQESAPWTRTQTQAQRGRNGPKYRVYYKKVVYDGGEFVVEDDVYVKKREDASFDDVIPEGEECRVCYRAWKALMIECDACLSGFHFKCLKPPLKEVSEGDWFCDFCEARKSRKKVELPEPPKWQKRVRILR